MKSQQPFTTDRIVRLVISLGLLTGIILLLGRLSGALLPFAIGWLIAYLLAPTVDFVQFRLRFRNRILSLVAVLSFFALIVAGIVAIIAPIIYQQTADLYHLVVRYVEEADWYSDDLPAVIQERLRNFLGDDQVLSVLDPSTLSQAAQAILPRLWVFVSDSYSALSAVLGLLIVLLYVAFILLDYRQMTNSWRSYLPDTYTRPLEELMMDFSQAMATYFRAQALIAFLNAVLFCLGFWIIGLPMGILLGIFVGLLNMIPYMQNIGIIPALFLALMQSLETGQSFWLLLLFVLIVFVVVGIIEQAILVPRIMGKATGINPALILLALSIWGSLLGLFGLIIALPFTTVLISFYRRVLLPQWNSFAEDDKMLNDHREPREPPESAPTDQV